MKNELLKLHEEWLQTGYMPESGLCASLPKKYRDTFEHLTPTNDDVSLLMDENKPIMFWGSGENLEDLGRQDRWHKYTELRQSLVLLLAEIIEDTSFNPKRKKK